MRRTQGWLGIGFGMGAMLVATTASAEPTPADRALATDLFDQAKQLVAEGKPEKACPKFAESQRLDPGVGTLLNLANCHELEGKTATAWSEFAEALASAERESQAELYVGSQADGSVRRVTLTGSAATLYTGLGQIQELHVDGNTIFCTTGNGGRVLALSVAGGTPVVIASGQTFPSYLATDADSVYWSDGPLSGAATIRKAKKPVK